MPFVVSGWGKDRSKHPNVPMDLVPSTRYLQAVKQECLDLRNDFKEVCKRNFKDDPDLVWCIGDSNNLQNGQCKGDSGGEMTIFYLLIS